MNEQYTLAEGGLQAIRTGSMWPTIYESGHNCVALITRQPPPPRHHIAHCLHSTRFMFIVAQPCNNMTQSSCHCDWKQRL